MNPEKLTNNHEQQPKESVYAPTVESFFDPVRAAEVWSKEIIGNESFLKQIESRKKLSESLDNVLNHLPKPDISFEKAISEGFLTEEKIAELYENLSDLLKSQDYKRIALYLPFEFLPNSNWNPSTEELQHSSEHFSKSYMEAWESLLSVHDVRANFIDGDVLEVEKRSGDLKRIVKAAHLIPKLVEKGLINFDYVISLLEKTHDQVLKDSVADALPVLADLGILDEKKLDLMLNSTDRLLVSMARIIMASKKAEINEAGTGPEEITFSEVQEKLYEKFTQIELEEHGDATKKRERWIKQQKKRQAVESSGNEISRAIISNTITSEEIAKFLTLEANTSSKKALIEGIRKAIEFEASTEFKVAEEIYNNYKEILLTFSEENNPEIQEILFKTFHHLNQLGIVDKTQLVQLGITIPKLAGPFSENLNSMKNEVEDIQKIISSVESNSELSKLIYPVALIYGSQLKGYGDQNADIDVAVFVRPGTSFDGHGALKELLEKSFVHEKIRDSIVEFWLKENEGKLEIINFEKRDVSLGKSSWAHILFDAAWEGNKDVIKELHEKLLASYMHDSGEIIYERNARSLYLEEMERDTLQYRLMHKGYERFFPACGGINTPHSDQIDSQSMFWDSGYRQLATKLFVNRVFLPQIKN